MLIFGINAHLINTAGTKVKVICQGQGRISRLHFSKNGHFGGISVSQTHLVFFFLFYSRLHKKSQLRRHYLGSPPSEFGDKDSIVACHSLVSVKTLPNNKIMAWTKLKAFADDKFYVTKIRISVCDGIENILGNS